MLNQILQLERGLVVLDLEATGSNPLTDRICQIALTLHRPDKEPIEWVSLVNPEMTIPQEAIDVHHITNEMVRAEGVHTLRQIGAELTRKVLNNCDFSGHNVMFDLRMLRAELARVSVPWDWEKTGAKVIDTLRLYQIIDPRTLEAAYERFCGKKLEGAHDAGVDVRATTEVLIGQLTEFPAIPRTVAGLADYCFPRRKDFVDKTGKLVWRNGVACISFGKNSGQSLEVLSKTNKGYLNWILKGDFPADTKKIVTDALAGVFPKPEVADPQGPQESPDASDQSTSAEYPTT